jgi:uncharacterized protein YvpB
MRINYDVPFFSQYDIDVEKSWQDKSCGLASLIMLIKYCGQPVDSKNLFETAIKNNAYLQNVGFKHKELADLAAGYGLRGENFDWAKIEKEEAFKNLMVYLEAEPIIASIYSRFDPESKDGHLIVLTGFDDKNIFYNDPQNGPDKSVSTETFLKGWKKRVIVVTP